MVNMQAESVPTRLCSVSQPRLPPEVPRPCPSSKTVKLSSWRRSFHILFWSALRASPSTMSLATS